MLNQQEIQEFFSLPINKRVDRFIEEELVPKEQVQAFKYSIILKVFREEFPALYYMYFTDLLQKGTPEYETCHKAYMQMMYDL